MIGSVKFGKVHGVQSKIRGCKALNNTRIAIKGGAHFSHIIGQPWMDLRSFMVEWGLKRKPVEPEGLGYRLLVDFSGFVSKDPNIQINLLDADPSYFKDYKLTVNSFLVHDSGNILFHVANRNAEKDTIEHPSTSDDFFVFTDHYPEQVIHSLIVAKKPISCPTALPKDQWNKLGNVINEELLFLGKHTAINKFGYRIEINNGYYAQSVAQMHAHIRSMDASLEVISK